MSDHILTDEDCDAIWAKALDGVPPIRINSNSPEVQRKIIREAYVQGNPDGVSTMSRAQDDEVVVLNQIRKVE